jgi:hypothetical protein
VWRTEYGVMAGLNFARVISQWEPFADGLSTVSRISSVRLAE